VFHLAAEVGGIGANRANPGRYWYANLQMGVNMLEQSRVHDVQKLVITGTVNSFGTLQVDAGATLELAAASSSFVTFSGQGGTLKLDTAAIFDKYIGETEKRIQKVFRVAEGLAPCVFWIDELEKIFAGSGPDSASVDAGVSSRILAAFLSWMQDRKAPVFVAATCNNVTVLPPELIRKGRFDELFFVDLPNQSERKQIFAIHLARRKRNPADFDLDRVAAAARGYSGAEIDAAVQTALYAAFSGKQTVNTQGLLDALKATVPLSTTRSEEIQALRGWAGQRAVAASIADAKGEGA